MRFREIFVVSVVAVLSMVAMPAASQDFEVSREGNWRLWFTSPDLRAELDYHWADKHPGDEWLIIKLAVAGGVGGGVTTVAREDIHLRAPDGTIFDLPTQTEFRGVRGSMSMAFSQENAWGPPASRFTRSLRRVDEWFFSPIGGTNHRDFINPSSIQFYSGPLVFQVPGGVQPGGWKLTIDLGEIRAEIPFVLGEND